LRHYFATCLIEKGVDLITIAAILGHSKLTTSLLYAHTDKERIVKALNILNAV
jgi:site-specific recombinase XerD